MTKDREIGPYEPMLILLHRLFDALLGAGIFSGLAWYYGMYEFYGQIHFIMTILIFFIALTCLEVAGAYQTWQAGPFLFEIHKLISGCLLVSVSLVIIIYFLKVSREFSRLVIGCWVISWPLLLIGERLLIRNFLRHQREKGRNVRRSVIAGAGVLGGRLARWITDNPWSGTKVIGFFDDKVREPVAGIPILDNLETIPTFIKQNNIDIVFLTLPMRAESKIQRLVADLADSTVSIYFVPDIFFFDFVLGGVTIFYGDIPAVALRESPLRGFNSVLKRTEDLVLSSIMLLFALPIMVLISIIIKLTSKGPVLFKQWRYGLDGKPIQIYKFRTMTVCEDGYEFNQATPNDPRITAFGSFLRKTSFDELPQLVNILQGRMSIVGPRPHPVKMNEAFRKLVPGYMLRHKIKPGLTGLSQVNGFRGETDTLKKMNQRVEHDLEYLRNWSVLVDLKIIFKTILIILRTNP